MSKTIVQSVAEFDQVVQENGTFLFFKNSTTCPISHAAFEEFENFVAEQNQVPCFYLNVQEARSLSNYIAETFDIKHESPQALLFKNGKVAWNASHWKITYSSLQENVK
ncbi:bacillithiol system redox-active protein YtxJ [Sutcliffiella horikoshii]|uniref:bacillithiol system redox-active protein YtxJ n=1 Tax=Sutcliffiella horikoshii TaxID=79883 RepID=UPI001CFE2300|nr:bacillithiol system redox-active protein YtxJ [Sutcliffiella horikoshii]